MTENQSPDGDAVQAAPKRPNPAASAASRARRIGGVRPTAGAAPTSNPVDPVAETSEPVTTSGRVNVNKSAATAQPVSAPPNTKSGGDSDPIVITQVPGWLRWAPALVLTVCAVAMIVIFAITAHGVWYGKPTAATVRDQVLAAAKTCIVATNTYTYTNIPKYEAAGERCTTGRFTDEYKSAMKTLVTPDAKKLQASQSVQINAAGVESISRGGQQWGIVLYGQTTVTQKSTGKKNASRVDPFALTVTMQHVSGKWLISKYGLLTSASD